MKRSPRSSPIVMLALLWLVGWTLRVPVLAAPPLATRFADTFGLEAAGIGALTMLPVVAIAFGAIPAALIINRFGVKTAIVGGVLLMATASLARGYAPSSAILFVVSVVMGLGIAVFQTALPAATRIWTPGNIALGNAVYLNGMMVGEMSGAGLTLPMVLPMAGGDWRMALLLWSVPGCADCPGGGTGPVAHSGTRPCLRRGRTRPLPCPAGTTCLSGNTVCFWPVRSSPSMSSTLTSRSFFRCAMKPRPWPGFCFCTTQRLCLRRLPVLAAPYWIGRRAPIAASAALSVVGLAGFTFLTGWASWLSALLTGFAASVELILLVSLPAAIATGRAVTRLSAEMTLVGYGVAFVLPLVGGWMAKRVDWLEFALIPSLVFGAVVLLLVGRQREYPKYQ